LDKLYTENNNYQTCIRGLKVRGVFDTMREADIRCQVLKKVDPYHNVYIAQAGVWCPWSPNPNDIEDQKFAESHLNTLMHNYKENQDKKDIFYEERKRELQFIKTKDTLNKSDPWIDAQGPSVDPSLIKQASEHVVIEVGEVGEHSNEDINEIVGEATEAVAEGEATEAVAEGEATETVAVGETVVEAEATETVVEAIETVSEATDAVTAVTAVDKSIV
jgi:hypothetical protein